MLSSLHLFIDLIKPHYHHSTPPKPSSTAFRGSPVDDAKPSKVSLYRGYPSIFLLFCVHQFYVPRDYSQYEREISDGLLLSLQKMMLRKLCIECAIIDDEVGEEEEGKRVGMVGLGELVQPLQGDYKLLVASSYTLPELRSLHYHHLLHQSVRSCHPKRFIPQHPLFLNLLIQLLEEISDEAVCFGEQFVCFFHLPFLPSLIITNSWDLHHSTITTGGSSMNIVSSIFVIFFIGNGQKQKGKEVDEKGKASLFPFLKSAKYRSKPLRWPEVVAKELTQTDVQGHHNRMLLRKDETNNLLKELSKEEKQMVRDKAEKGQLPRCCGCVPRPNNPPLLFLLATATLVDRQKQKGKEVDEKEKASLFPILKSTRYQSKPLGWPDSVARCHAAFPMGHHNRLLIHKDEANVLLKELSEEEKRMVCGEGEKGLLALMLDEEGRLWVLIFIYWSSNCTYILKKDWSKRADSYGLRAWNSMAHHLQTPDQRII
ncbi:hypothetical protein EJ110_NYTH37456 [Nymphaea thermarum]|nr:hypothetical protein EJ110_NYTH37456 [Nymphaea thermarum]